MVKRVFAGEKPCRALDTLIDVPRWPPLARSAERITRHNSPVHATAKVTSTNAVLPLRNVYRQEMNCQIVHDSIHRRTGWTTTYALTVDEMNAGFGSIAIGGPWTGKPAIFEFYVLPVHRGCAFQLFEAFLAASGARLMEIQSNDALLAVMLHTYARDIRSEKIVFRDGVTTALESNGAVLEPMTGEEDARRAIAALEGGPEWRLRLDNETVATGGILFHYNPPYGDIYMDVAEPFRRRGFGAYLVQELKRAAYELATIPGARCSPDNSASRLTLQKAGFVPYAHMLTGAIR
jgi:GNAT superfamily N-acetyltransferase